MKVGLFGTGAYGLALSSVLNDNNIEVTMWTKFVEEKNQLEQTRKNDTLLPGYNLSEEIKLTTSVEECCKDKDLIIIAIPVPFIDGLCNELKQYIGENQHICIASKGIEQSTGLFIHEIVQKYINIDRIAVISGPSFAKDMITKKTIGLTLATTNTKTKEIVKHCLENNYIKLRYTNDIIGTEICGSIKNVIAIASGILDSLGANDSTKAMFVTDALYDISEIIKVFNGDPKTVLSYAGFGDLLLTCTSENSRNYSFGQIVGKGLSDVEIKKYLENNTVEGYFTLESIHQLLKSKNINIQIIDTIYDIINCGKAADKLLDF